MTMHDRRSAAASSATSVPPSAAHLGAPSGADPLPSPWWHDLDPETLAKVDRIRVPIHEVGHELATDAVPPQVRSVIRLTIVPEGDMRGQCVTVGDPAILARIPADIRAHEEATFTLAGCAAESVILDAPQLYAAHETHEAHTILARVYGDDLASRLRADLWDHLRRGFSRPDVSAILEAVAGRLRIERRLSGETVRAIIASMDGFDCLREAFSAPRLDRAVAALLPPPLTPPPVRHVEPLTVARRYSGPLHAYTGPLRGSRDRGYPYRMGGGLTWQLLSLVRHPPQELPRRRMHVRGRPFVFVESTPHIRS